MGRLSGKIAIVTGAASGLGRATAQRLVAVKPDRADVGRAGFELEGIAVGLIRGAVSKLS